MCGIVSYNLFEVMEEFAGIKCRYTKEEIEKMKEAHEQVREGVFLDIIYGAKSKISN